MARRKKQHDPREDDDSAECPCPCSKCGTIVDLHDMVPRRGEDGTRDSSLICKWCKQEEDDEA